MNTSLCYNGTSTLFIVLQWHKYIIYCVSLTHKQCLYKDKIITTLILLIIRFSLPGTMYLDLPFIRNSVLIHLELFVLRLGNVKEIGNMKFNYYLATFLSTFEVYEASNYWISANQIFWLCYVQC